MFSENTVIFLLLVLFESSLLKGRSNLANGVRSCATMTVLNLCKQIFCSKCLPSVSMEKRTKWALETASFLPESAGYVGDIMGKLAVRAATVPFQEETTRLALKT